ncbi:MAG: Mur ligase domain-containing protein, partial [Gammaproteobacteria bacterium]
MMAASRTEYSTGMPLSALLEGYVQVSLADEREILGLSLDSRNTRPGDLFLALRGVARHGADFIQDAVRAGAVAGVWESGALVSSPSHAAPMFEVADLNQKIGDIAARFYGHPSHDLTVIGVTGTNGKTSVTHFLAQALTEASAPCGIIGTLGNGIYG